MGAQDWGSKAPKIVGLTAAATISLDPTLGTIFTWNPNEAETINATSPGFPDEVITCYIDTINTTTRAITFGTNFRTSAVINTGATSGIRWTISFRSNGLGWTEFSRSGPIA